MTTTIKIREIEHRATYIYVRLDQSLHWSAKPDLMQWCKDRECGKMVNNYAISFKNEDELTMFRLKWC